MKRLLLGLSLVIGIWMLSPTPQAEAYGWSHGSHYRGHYNRGRYSWGHSWWSHHSGHKGGFAAPELDLGAAGGAMVLLLGGVAYIASRRREESLT